MAARWCSRIWYDSKYNGFVLGTDFAKIGKFQSGIAFTYGSGDTTSVGGAAYSIWFHHRPIGIQHIVGIERVDVNINAHIIHDTA